MTVNGKKVTMISYVKKIAVFLGVASICSLTGYYAIASKPPENIETTKESQQVGRMPVSFRGVESETYPARITGLGEVVPLWKTAIRAQVDGQIV